MVNSYVYKMDYYMQAVLSLTVCMGHTCNTS